MSFIKEFKEFALKGSVMDMAVGIIIGAAFKTIIDSVVNDLVMPLVSAIVGAPDFSNMYIVLKGNVPDGASLADARKVAGSSIFAYGNFITVAVNFILLALAIFLMIKAMNSLRKKKEEVPAAPPAPTATETLLTEIRDALKHK